MTAAIGRAAMLASIIALAAVGCSATVDRPSPAPFPPRPANLAVDSLRPCSMLNDQQRIALGLRAGTPRTTSVNGLPSPICTWVGEGGIGYNVQTIPISADTARSEVGATFTVVNGFGAVRSIVDDFTGGGPTCQLTVDAAPERVIRIQAGASPRPPLPSDEEMCRLATEAASMVMTTVVGTGT